MENKLNRYELWLGDYNLGQGYHTSGKPELLAVVESVNFKTACMKYELERKLERIKQGEILGNLNMQDYPWWFNEYTISNSWTGKYYQSAEEALESFRR